MYRLAAWSDCGSRPIAAVPSRTDHRRKKMLGLRYFLAPLVGVALSTVAAFAGPSPAPVTPQLVDAAKQEGKVVFYTSIELQTAEKIAKAFEAAYPGIAVQVERNGCERLFQRLAQERDSNIHSADAVECSDMTA